jgi:phosphoribosylamine--glycine ligase
LKFLIVSNAAEGAHIGKIIANEGNDVELYIREPGYRQCWNGLLPKAKKINPSKDTVVIFDQSGMGAEADKLKKAGHFVVGASKWADRLEHDREFGFEVMEQCGIKFPFTTEFDDFGRVGEFLKENDEDDDGCPRRFVFKPEGDDLPAHLTYCSLDSEDLLKYLEYVKKNYSKSVKNFILQEFVEGSVVSSEMWSDGSRFIRPSNHTVEAKKFMDGDLGPATGCSGNLVWVEDGSCRIVSNGILKLEELAAEEGHVGPLDLNAVVNDEGVFGLEWTPRFGYAATPTLMFLMHDGSIGKFFSDLARGQVSGDMPLRDMFAAAITVSIPPYPLEAPSVEDVQRVRPNVGIPIRGLDNKNAGSFYFYEVEEQDGQLLHSTGSGALGLAVGVGETPWEAFRGPCHALGELMVPEKQYRTDLCEVLSWQYEMVEHQDAMSLGTLPGVELGAD